jgi:uncharacterized C2H2 Zn-finger protein
MKNKGTMISHVESTHIQTVINCPNCKKVFKATNYLKTHLKKTSCGQGGPDS